MLAQAYGVARQMIELREEYHLTQVELAEKTGFPQAQISRNGRGVVRPTSATLAKIAEAYRCLTFVSSSGLSTVLGGALPADGRGAPVGSLRPRSSREYPAVAADHSRSSPCG